MIWMYGGGFTTGCALESVFGPQSLTNEGVIVVTFNYRLGLYGFLSTNDSVILGNAGLKDQLLAMKWTQKNIEFFGGDPEKVTIFGESAGGVSVGAHVANKKSAGLYRAAICQSGCSLAILPSVIQSDPRQTAYDIAKSINPFVSEATTTEEIRDFLQSLPADILDIAFNANPQFSYSGTVGNATVEGTGKVGHGEDVRYLFDRTEFSLTTEEEFLTKSRMTRLWTNFAKTLNPTPDEIDPLLNVTWPQVSGLNIPYLGIDETLEVKPGKKVKEMEMWNDVFYTYGQQPFSGF
ncbi:acetylcholinesterase-like [Cylas formicarius]|uniref:acetylcholinesterase-like n=1 Tax=Cylas formicarius TaxID=197179 RepID=UPI0029583820|nr:acetylcholinesterase-like [Cylas formicarius]